MNLQKNCSIYSKNVVICSTEDLQADYEKLLDFAARQEHTTLVLRT